MNSKITLLCWINVALDFPVISLSKQMQLRLGSQWYFPGDGPSPLVTDYLPTNPVLEGSLLTGIRHWPGILG